MEFVNYAPKLNKNQTSSFLKHSSHFGTPPVIQNIVFLNPTCFNLNSSFFQS